MRTRITRKLVLLAALAVAVVFASLAYSHCQVPCGIYGDDTRFTLIAEHITTIEKSMVQIGENMDQDPPNGNQIVRWVNNKEKHADEISHIVTYYFMAQRIKPAEKFDTKAHQKYIKQLTLLHEMLISSMKAKQTTDLSNIEKLSTLLAEFRDAYL